MLVKNFLPSGDPVTIVVPTEVLDRLIGTCFRGSHQKLAGNFSQWNSIGVMLRDVHVSKLVLEEIDLALQGRQRDNVSFTIKYPGPVGWEGTAPLESYRAECLETFRLNKRASALRVKTELGHILVPQTNLITLVCEVKTRQNGRHIATIWSVYPGVDVGDLVGHVTQREKRVFFDCNHPGA